MSEEDNAPKLRLKPKLAADPSAAQSQPATPAEAAPSATTPPVEPAAAGTAPVVRLEPAPSCRRV